EPDARSVRYYMVSLPARRWEIACLHPPVSSMYRYLRKIGAVLCDRQVKDAAGGVLTRCIDGFDGCNRVFSLDVISAAAYTARSSRSPTTRAETRSREAA